MNHMMGASLIIAGAGSIVGLVVCEVISRVFKEEWREKITLRFRDGETKTLKWTKHMDEAERERLIRDAVKEKTPLSRFEAFKLFLVKGIIAIAIFSMFILTSIIIGSLTESFGVPQFTILLRIIKLNVLVLGGVLCVTFVLRITIQFVRYLIKGPP